MDALKKLQYLQRSKKIGIAYLLWITFGICGAHNFYMSCYVQGGIQLALMLWGLFFILGGFGFSIVFFLILFVWWIVDAFLIPSQVKKENMRITIKLESEH